MLCGTSFGKQIRRHRLFETSFPVEPLPCKHEGYVLNPHNADGRKRIREQFGPEANVEGVWRKELGVGWMSGHEARESIPPTYTDYIGQYLMGYLKGR
jgi:DNA (cytosine-5)-methyltransferase 1